MSPFTFTATKRPRCTFMSQAEDIVSSLYSTLKQVELAVSTQQSDFVGVRTNSSLQLTAQLELLQTPGLPFILPKVRRSALLILSDCSSADTAAAH